jgi:TolB-like protein/Flp pilus assembly protein TadD
LIGTTVGHYRVLGRLGSGGMGEVFRAEDLKLGRLVALKVLPEALAADPAQLARFEREARALAALSHPHIVGIHSIEEHDGLRFLTMELVEGTSLDHAIPRKGFAVDAFLSVAVPVAEALAVAHARGIVHRDLKPGNIMLGEDGLVKVLDFGLAKLRPETPPPRARDRDRSTETLTEVGQIVGTVAYMAPEQLEGFEVDHRTDIFSLGVLLYEMATGERPFRGRSSADLMSAILRSEPAPLTTVRGGLPEQLGRIVRMCLEKDPARRYQSAGDVANELRSLQREVEDARPTRRLRVPGATRRRAAIVLLAVLALLAGALLWRGREGGGSAVPVRGPVAVLPFANLTGDPGNTYLSDGISADLIQRLSEVRGLRLIGRSEAWALRGEEGATARLAERLGVAMVVEGDLQTAAEALRLNVGVVDCESGVVVWSHRLEVRPEHLLAVQRELARQLASVLEVGLSAQERGRLAKDPTSSFEAFDTYLRAVKLAEASQDPGDVRVAVDLFSQALDRDPAFALAHVGRSEALWTLYHLEGNPESLIEAEREAERALALDPELAVAKLALAKVYRSTGRYDSAIATIEGVLADYPHPDDAQRGLAFSHEQVGELDEARSSYRAATSLGPENWFNWNALGAFLIRTGEYEEARDALEQAVELAPKRVVRPLQNLASLSIFEGDFEAALEAYARFPRPITSAGLASNIATAYYFSGRPDRLEQAELYYRRALELNPGNPEVHGNLADLLGATQRPDEAAEHYRTALSLVERKLEAVPDPNPAAFAEWRPLLLQKSTYAAKARECSVAAPLAAQLRREIPETPRDLHDLAYVFALCGEPEAALEALERAVELGFSAELIHKEDEFAPLRGLEGFQALGEAG